nr:50S ribosomal protein L4P [uncultured archaeon]
MKTKLYLIDGKHGKEIEMPKEFSAPIRQDILQKVLEAKKTIQPYGAFALAGKQQVASGIIIRRRHVWKSGYGHGSSRVPRKRMMRRGTQFSWVGAFAPGTVGGRKAHPPKPKINDLKINKKELKIAFVSALSATANSEMISKKYLRLNDKKISAPFVVESKFTELKTQKLLGSLEKILGELFEVAVKKKSIRAGRGKMRGRRYKSNAGMLFVVGKNEKLKTTKFDVTDAKNLNVLDLAQGSAGRIVVYTEQAIKDLGERLK